MLESTWSLESVYREFNELLFSIYIIDRYTPYRCMVSYSNFIIRIHGNILDIWTLGVLFFCKGVKVFWMLLNCICTHTLLNY